MVAEDIAFAAQLEALREALATGEGEPGEVGGGVAGGAFKQKQGSIRLSLPLRQNILLIFLCDCPITDALHIIYCILYYKTENK
jgi:hypothetical protein